MADITFDVVDLAEITIHNHSQRLVAFVITIVPAVVANATALPWGRIFNELQQPGGVARVARGFFESLGRGLIGPEE